jgi:hypothetical protein
MRFSSPSARTSNVTSIGGVSPASRLIRDSAGWMRCDSASQSRRSEPPTDRATTSSPSTTQRSGNSAFTASTISGK